MTNEEIISNLETILLDCDKSIDFWTKQLEKECRDNYKRGCLEMIELQNKQKESYKYLIKELKIEIPEGYEIDKENSSFEKKELILLTEI